MGPRATCFCRLLIFSRIILTLVEVCESSNITSCVYERPDVNHALTLPATVTYTYTGVMTSQTACSLACCSKESSCAGFVYEKGSKTCLMAVKVIVIFNLILLFIFTSLNMALFTWFLNYYIFKVRSLYYPDVKSFVSRFVKYVPSLTTLHDFYTSCFYIHILNVLSFSEAIIYMQIIINITKLALVNTIKHDCHNNY